MSACFDGVVAVAEETHHFVDQVFNWRYRELVRLFPTMPDKNREELAAHSDTYLVHEAASLAELGCPALLAYRILRPLPE